MSFYVSALNGKARPLWFLFFQHHLSNQLVALKGEAIFAFVFEMRVHDSHQEISGHVQAEKEELISFYPPTNLNVTSEMPRI